MNNINKTLREQAIANGLCQQWQKKWNRSLSQDELAGFFYDGLDFCLKHRWPTNQFIKENFSIDFLRKVGVFVDDTRSVLNKEQCVILGKSKVRLRYNSSNDGNVYVRDSSFVFLESKGSGLIIVHLFDKATITARQHGTGSIVVIKHSEDVTITADDDVKIVEEYDYLKE